MTAPTIPLPSGWFFEEDTLNKTGWRIMGPDHAYVLPHAWKEPFARQFAAAMNAGGDAGALRWRHKKSGGTYAEVGRAQLQTSGDPESDYMPMVVYRSERDGSLWVRPVFEFEDGRFEALAAHRERAKQHEAERPMKMLVDNDWLRRGIETDLDDAEFDVVLAAPDAVKAAIEAILQHEIQAFYAAFSRREWSEIGIAGDALRNRLESLLRLYQPDAGVREGAGDVRPVKIVEALLAKWRADKRAQSFYKIRAGEEILAALAQQPEAGAKDGAEEPSEDTFRSAAVVSGISVATLRASWRAMDDVSAAHPTPKEPEQACCIACAQPLKAGDRVLDDTVNGGALHFSCCDPACYVNEDGEPLGPSDPPPEGYLWEAAPLPSNGEG